MSQMTLMSVTELKNKNIPSIVRNASFRINLIKCKHRFQKEINSSLVSTYCIDYIRFRCPQIVIFW